MTGTTVTSAACGIGETLTLRMTLRVTAPIQCHGRVCALKPHARYRWAVPDNLNQTSRPVRRGYCVIAEDYLLRAEHAAGITRTADGE